MVTDTPSRDDLIAQFYPRIARKTAALFYKTMPPYQSIVDKDDLEMAAAAGIIYAIDHFDSTRGMTLESFVVMCARGHVTTSLRVVNKYVRLGAWKESDLPQLMEGTLQLQDITPDRPHLDSEPFLDLLRDTPKLTSSQRAELIEHYIMGRTFIQMGIDRDKSPHVMSRRVQQARELIKNRLIT